MINISENIGYCVPSGASSSGKGNVPGTYGVEIVVLIGGNVRAGLCWILNPHTTILRCQSPQA